MVARHEMPGKRTSPYHDAHVESRLALCPDLTGIGIAGKSKTGH
jgi:hypothetical protein